MTRKSKREIERAIDTLRDSFVPENIDVTSSVVTITEDDVDGGGTVDLDGPEAAVDQAVPPALQADSDVVDVQVSGPESGAER